MKSKYSNKIEFTGLYHPDQYVSTYIPSSSTGPIIADPIATKAFNRLEKSLMNVNSELSLGFNTMTDAIYDLKHRYIFSFGKLYEVKVFYNTLKGVTTLVIDEDIAPIYGDFHKKVYTVKLIDGEEFDLEKAIAFLVLKACGVSSSKINKLYSKLTFKKRVKVKKEDIYATQDGKIKDHYITKDFIYTDKFYEYLILKHYNFEMKELHDLMSSMWNPEKDLETSFLYFYLDKELDISPNVVKQLADKAIERNGK